MELSKTYRNVSPEHRGSDKPCIHLALRRHAWLEKCKLASLCNFKIPRSCRLKGHTFKSASRDLAFPNPSLLRLCDSRVKLEKLRDNSRSLGFVTLVFKRSLLAIHQLSGTSAQMAPEYAPFVYTPLQPGQIRLLQPVVLSGGELRWDLQVVQFQDSLGQDLGLEYDALSYVWGDSSPEASKFPVICNNQKLEVHHNLNIALPFLAFRNSELPIWIDAICINQADDCEKMKQIGIMVNIFQRASQVWVWLGPGYETSGVVISQLPQIVTLIEANENRGPERILDPPTIMPWLDSNEGWFTFYDLVQNEWYERLWVVQEAAFAMRIRFLLGKHEIEWHILDRIISARTLDWQITATDGSEPRFKRRSARNIFKAREITQEATKAGRVLSTLEATEIIISTMRSFCSDPRDRVFALSGFITLEIPHTTPVTDMYVQLARHILLNVDLDSVYWWAFLSSASFSNKMEGLPSWCPDFHNLAGQDWVFTLVMNYSASIKKNKVDREFDIHSKELALRGQIFDTVDTTFDEFHDDTDEDQAYDFLTALHTWEKTLAAAVSSKLLPLGSSDAHVDVKTIEHIYWKTLTSDLFGRDNTEFFQAGSLEDFRASFREVLGPLQTLE